MDSAWAISNSVRDQRAFKDQHYGDMLQGLRECAAALEALIDERPSLAAKRAGSTTLGNLLAETRSLIDAPTTKASAPARSEDDDET